MRKRKIEATVFKSDKLPEFTKEIIFLSDFDFLSSKFNNPEYIVFPGFCDVHVHFREPGFSYKETILTGSKAAARGGYTDVGTMPNLNPVPDSLKNLRAQTEIIKKDACIGVHPYGSITLGEKGERIADMEEMAPYVVGFSDDGRGVQSPLVMEEAMRKAKVLNKLIVAHCEDNSLLKGGYIHDGEYARVHGHRGICSKSEWGPIKRDIELIKKTDCAYHVCHISCKESVELIRKAKAEGVDITCETAPHYLIFDDSDLQELGRFKMNPPIRDKADREALIEGLIDGTIDMISTDHAPHSEEEKSKGLEKSVFGVVGLEIAFPALYTFLVKTKIISMEKLIELLAINSRRRFKIPFKNDFTVWSLGKEAVVDTSKFLSKGRATPFEGISLFGECVLTVRNGKSVWEGGKLI